MDAKHPTAKALSVGGGRILAVGTEAEADRWRGKRTKAWTLEPRQSLVPGFIDAHAHIAHDAWRRTWVDLEQCTSLEGALDRLRARVAEARQGDWIVARGWDESAWPVKRYLTRHELDRVSVSHPILANRVDGHMCSVNSAVLRRIAFAEGADGVERAPDGTPTGVLKEGAAKEARDAIPAATDQEWARLLEDQIRYAHALGITAVHDVVGATHVRAYQELRRQDRLELRAYLMPYAELLDSYLAAGLRTGFGDDWLRLGALKVFADGSFGARTAALFDPYDDEPRATGQLIQSPKELTSLLAKAHGAGFQLAVHAIGDRGVDVVIEAFSRVLDREPRDDHRHRIEHAELFPEDGLERTKAMGLVASMQPNFVARWSQPGGLYERRLGQSRLSRNNPYREILDAGIPLAFGSDGMPYGPLYGIAGAARAPWDGQRITASEALRAYTCGGAFAGFAESDVGSLLPGRCADFVVLSADPRREPDPSVVATVVGGRVVHGSASG
ncbi:MAG TPA: amidohydrolase [Thermoplasmata archaeon]|nr:amidohydrolase [Thermoplasmata archaeon]